MTIGQLSLFYLLMNLSFFVLPAFIMHFGVIGKWGSSPKSALAVATVLGYIFGNLSVHAKWERRWRFANFYDPPAKEQLLAASDSAGNIMFWLYLGWLPAFVYALLWLWFIRYVRK